MPKGYNHRGYKARTGRLNRQLFSFKNNTSIIRCENATSLLVCSASSLRQELLQFRQHYLGTHFENQYEVFKGIMCAGHNGADPIKMGRFGKFSGNMTPVWAAPEGPMSRQHTDTIPSSGGGGGNGGGFVLAF
jgi:hypothetical protein